MRRRPLITSLILVLFLLTALGVWQRDRLYPYAALVLPLDAAPAASIPELVLETNIPLGAVRGRIDHMAFDPGRQRLFIAELENKTVSVIDVGNRKVEMRLTGFNEPQGIGFAPKSEMVFITNGGTGIVEMRRGADLSVVRKVSLDSDADNVRVGEDGLVYVGYGDGAIAVLDSATGEVLKILPLAAHPESFQIEPGGPRIFVNEPKALRVGVIDRQSGQELARWGALGAASNFPMALDVESRRLFVAYRLPAILTVFDTSSGEVAGRIPACGDADDVFYDRDRKRVYTVCGDGSVSVVAATDQGIQELARLATRRGARTGLYVSNLQRLFVAAPARGANPAAVFVYDVR